MSELLDKQVNVRKESLKKLLGCMQAHEKVCIENERKRNDLHMMFLIEGSTHTKNQ